MSNFRLHKLRSLSGSNPGDRQPVFGTFLRNSSLDELPQLWNIAKGEMNFVGPRPLPTDYLPYFTKAQQFRFVVRPGLTGLAQVNGRSHISWDEKLAYDLKYVRGRSFGMDLLILLRTLWQVPFGRKENPAEESFPEFQMRKEQTPIPEESAPERINQ